MHVNKPVMSCAVFRPDKLIYVHMIPNIFGLVSLENIKILSLFSYKGKSFQSQTYTSSLSLQLVTKHSCDGGQHV